MWYRFQGDETWRDYASFDVLTYASEVARFAWRHTADSLGRAGRALRDVFFAANGEWKQMPHAMRAHGDRHTPLDEYEPAAVEVETAVQQS